MATPLDHNESDLNWVKLNTREMDMPDKRPDTVDQVVDELIAELPLEPKVSVANLGKDELRVLEETLGKYLRFRLDQLDTVVNEALRDDCIARSDDKTLDDVDTATVILKELWERLRRSHRMRVVK